MVAKGVKKAALSKVEDDLQRELSARELLALLDRAGLPSEYPRISPSAQREARLSSLTSWFDVDQPHVLCTDTEKFIKAMFLWVEFYEKPAECNQGVYYFNDPTNKYDMFRLVMAPSLEEGKPARSIVKATRRVGKTKGLVIQLMKMMGIVRPFTLQLLSELNDTRTGEEIDEIKSGVEENDQIHSDFGGEGVLFPRRSGTKKWNSHRLDFIHHPRSSIMGHSLKSAQRGRGPIFGVIDDPEDEDLVQNVDWRRWFFNRLLSVYCRMFTFGGKLCWIGTPVDERSCLSIAYKGMVVDEEKDDAIHADSRLDGWRKGNFAIIQRDVESKTGWTALQPDRYSLETFLHDLETDPISTMKEVLCEPATPGTRAFRRNRQDHGFMLCKDRSGAEWYLDLSSGFKRPLREFLAEIRVFGAGDLADGQSSEADPGALVYIGIDSRGIKHVLDCYNKRCFSDKLIEMAYILCEEWECERMGWERAGLQCVILRQVEQYIEKLRAEGKAPPVFDELENAGKNKIRRILSMIPLFTRKEIRFRYLDPIETPEGDVFTPIDYPRRPMYIELLSQVDEYTDEGLRRHEDLVDALEMAMRLTLGQIANVAEIDEDPVEAGLKNWEKVGITFDIEQIPRQAWNQRIMQEIEERQRSILENTGDVLAYV